MKVLYGILLGALLICSIEDIRRCMISVPFVSACTVALGVTRVCQGRFSIGLLAGVAVTVLVASLVSYCSGGQLGMGDGFLFGMTAMGLGIRCNLYMLVYTFFAVFVVAVLLLVFFHKGRNIRIPLAPFLFCSSLLTIL